VVREERGAPGTPEPAEEPESPQVHARPATDDDYEEIHLLQGA